MAKLLSTKGLILVPSRKRPKRPPWLPELRCRRSSRNFSTCCAPMCRFGCYCSLRASGRQGKRKIFQRGIRASRFSGGEHRVTCRRLCAFNRRGVSTLAKPFAAMPERVVPYVTAQCERDTDMFASEFNEEGNYRLAS